MLNKIYITNINIVGSELTLSITGKIFDEEIAKGIRIRPKLTMHFINKDEDRRIPFVINDVLYDDNVCTFHGTYVYKLDYIFWNSKNKFENVSMYLNFSYGNFYKEKIIIDTSNINVNYDDLHFNLDIKNNKLIFSSVIAENEKKDNIIIKILRFVRFVLKNVFYFVYKTILVVLFFIEGVLSILRISNSPHKMKGLNVINHLIAHINIRLKKVGRAPFKKSKLKSWIINIFTKLLYLKPIEKNKVTFISVRRNDLSGNFKYVYNELKDNKNIKIKFLYNTKLPRDYNIIDVYRFIRACVTSRVVVVDEYTPMIHKIDLKKQTKVVQLWHACGAFKTFGFTRLGKPKGSKQTTKNHRNYDFATVSSTYCKKCYAEGFGISTEKVVPTGIPRTDVFFDKRYKEKVQSEFFERHPNFKDKKIILFAPTFRGHTKETAEYPTELFDIRHVLESISDDYVIVIKHHPFIREKHPIPSEYSDRIFDASDDAELNDLLFVSDIVISDYSSLIFEASLLKIPMIFFAYDLQRYIKDRDFYFDFIYNVPGKIVENLEDLIKAINNNDFETYKIDGFSKMFFDDFDGKSSQRVAKLIESIVKE